MCSELQLIRCKPTSVSVTKRLLLLYRLRYGLHTEYKRHEVFSSLYSARRQRQSPNPNLRTNPDANSNPKVNKSYFNWTTREDVDLSRSNRMQTRTWVHDSSIKDYFLSMVRNIVFVNFKHWSINKNWLVCLAVFLFIFSRFFFLSYCKFFASLICMETTLLWYRFCQKTKTAKTRFDGIAENRVGVGTSKLALGVW